MEFVISREEILHGLHLTQSIVDKKSTMPILSNALFQLGPEKLRISATDLEVGVEVELTVLKKGAEGRAALPAKSIYEIAKELKEDEISFKSKSSGWMEVASGKSQFKIVQLGVDEFPTMPPVDPTRLVKINREDLAYLIEKTFFAISTDEAKYSLNGVFLERISSEDIRMVATDGHRLAQVDRSIPFLLEKGVIIPRKGISEMKKILASEGEIQFGVDGKNAILKSGKATLIVRLIEGEFPDYRKVIPQGQDKMISIERDSFLGALKRVALLNQDRSRGVRMIFSSGNLEIRSNNPDLGEAKEELDISYKGERFEIGFNPGYFLDVIHAISDEEIVVEMKDEISPCVIRSEYDRKLLNVVMPMRL